MEQLLVGWRAAAPALCMKEQSRGQIACNED